MENNWQDKDDEKWTRTAETTTYGRRSTLAAGTFLISFSFVRFKGAFLLRDRIKTGRRRRHTHTSRFHLSTPGGTPNYQPTYLRIEWQFFIVECLAERKVRGKPRKQRPKFGFGAICQHMRPHSAIRNNNLFSVGCAHLRLQLHSAKCESLIQPSRIVIAVVVTMTTSVCIQNFHHRRRRSRRHRHRHRRNVYLLCVWQLLAIFGIACGPTWFVCDAFRHSLLARVLRQGSASIVIVAPRKKPKLLLSSNRNKFVSHIGAADVSIAAYANFSLISQPVRHGCLQFGNGDGGEVLGQYARNVTTHSNSSSSSSGSSLELRWKRQTVHCLTFILLLRTN